MTPEQKIIKNKSGLLELAQMLGNVSQACKVMDCSRDNFYRFRNSTNRAGRRPCKRYPAVNLSSRTASRKHIEQAEVEIVIENPALEHLRASNELRKNGIIISQGGVRGIWLRHDRETFRKRLKVGKPHEIDPPLDHCKKTPYPR